MQEIAPLPGPSAAPALPACYLAPAGASAHALDLNVHSALARLTGGVSPIALSLAFQDWLMHLAVSPGKQLELAGTLKGLGLAWLPASSAAVDNGDARFSAPDWSNWPYNVLARAFTQTEQFWNQATSGVRGVAPHHAQVVNFTARQLLDMGAPSNYFWSNPEVLRRALESRGQSVLAGWSNWLRDLAGQVPASGEGGYVVGRDVALTPGKVVYRNELVELIEYAPQTASVYREPVLIVPSWIMKYYILDLSPHNSLVRFLVQQGHTVFMVSWRNPDAADRGLDMDDYLHRGIFDVLQEVDRLSEAAPVHAVGYCLGGTLLAIAAAALGSGRHGRPAELRSVTLLAAQTDFTEPGELGLFIDDSELAMLDALMWRQGYLDGRQMAGSFQLLNSRDLIWSRMMHDYLLGQHGTPNDLMAWNADTTRLPYRMHSEYLNQLFLHNDLAEGRYRVDGKAVALNDIKAPLFVVGTERDHVSPWRSVYKIHVLADAAVDFVLASGGHNAGIVSEPGHARRSYRAAPHRARGAPYLAPEDWLQQAHEQAGSWWPHWQQWLAHHSSAEQVTAPVLAAALEDAPGRYVLAG